MAEIFEDYATDLLYAFGYDSDRFLAAAHAVVPESAAKAGYPMLWQQAALAVELSQRAAEMIGPGLPGSYRPGRRASNVQR